MLINVSSQSYKSWSNEQREAAEVRFGDIVDMNFPDIPAEQDEIYVVDLAAEWAEKIYAIREAYRKHSKAKNLYEDGILIMGEMTFCYALIDYIGSDSEMFYAATTERKLKYDNEGNEVEYFMFVKFRRYFSFWDEEYDELVDDYNVTE